MPGFQLKRSGKVSYLSHKQVANELLDETMRQAKIARRMYERTTENWETSPDFVITIIQDDFDIDVNIYTENQGIFTGLNRDIYFFLDYGTDERWAIVSDDWVSKSTPGTLETGMGVGNVILRGSQMIEYGLYPEEGIEARGYTDIIRIMMKPEFRRQMNNAFKRGVRKMKKEGWQ